MKVRNIVSPAIEIWFRIFGIWPNMSCASLCRLLWTILIIIEQILQYRYIIMHFHLIEFTEIMHILGSTMTYTIFLIKLVIFWCKQRTFNRILIMMAIDWEKCFNTKFSMFAICNAKLSQRFVNMTVILYSTTVLLMSSKIFLKHADDNIASNISTRLFIIDMDLPFDANQRFVYELIIIAQFFFSLLCADANCLLNALLINLILHIGGQIDILRENLKEIFPKNDKNPSHFEAKEAIREHQKIITFSKYIEDLYSYIAMVLFVSDSLIICCLGFTIVASIGRPDASESIIRNFLFYVVINMEAFIFCFSGEYLSIKSKSIGDAAYASFWYESDSRDSRIILSLIMRSQNQLTITIGRIMNLSLGQFTTIVKASASYISVLLAMY